MAATAEAPRTAQPAAVPLLPFVSGSHEHTEPAFVRTVTPGAAQQDLDPIDIPATGYLRHIFLEVTAAGGAGGTLAADGPWNLLKSVTLQDVGGTNIVNLTGYQLFIANLVGGYAFNQDPADCPWFVGSAPNPTFYLRVPCEIRRADGLGAIANQNSGAELKLLLSIAQRSEATSADWTTAPTVTIRGWVEAWTVPADTDGRGRPQAQVPPLLGTGQVWTKSARQVPSGDVSGLLQLKRVGQLIRNLVFIARDVNGVRSDAVFPDPVRFEWEGNTIHNSSQKYWQQMWFEKMVNAPRPTGVFCLPFGHGGLGRLGNEDPSLWLPTSTTSRVDINGNNTAAGSVELVLNEVAPIEVNQAERYVVPNDSSFHPPY